MKLTHPHDFPRLLVEAWEARSWRTPIEEKQDAYLAQERDRGGGWTAYATRAFDRVKKEMLQPTMIVARGMADLPGINVAGWTKGHAGHGGAGLEANASMNLYMAAGSFADNYGYGRRGKGVSALLVWQIDSKHFLSFGGDSESGPFNEAEVVVRPDCTPCLKHIFVKGATPSDLERHAARPVSPAERKLYGLGTYTVVKFKGRGAGGKTFFPIDFAPQLRSLVSSLNANPGALDEHGRGLKWSVRAVNDPSVAWYALPLAKRARPPRAPRVKAPPRKAPPRKAKPKGGSLVYEKGGRFYLRGTKGSDGKEKWFSSRAKAESKAKKLGGR